MPFRWSLASCIMPHLILASLIAYASTEAASVLDHARSGRDPGASRRVIGPTVSTVISQHTTTPYSISSTPSLCKFSAACASLENVAILIFVRL
ncbi:hypothetical protein DL98DRAFT_14760 [Cadophora sp. DSE1049]|nr:hypothetical protein DL98DRAFT_14760 [Cadophora sp. DSE1049]